MIIWDGNERDISSDSDVIHEEMSWLDLGWLRQLDIFIKFEIIICFFYAICTVLKAQYNIIKYSLILYLIN